MRYVCAEPPNRTGLPRTIADRCRLLAVKDKGPNLYLIFQSRRHSVFPPRHRFSRQFASARGARPRSGLCEERSAVGFSDLKCDRHRSPSRCGPSKPEQRCERGINLGTTSYFVDGGNSWWDMRGGLSAEGSGGMKLQSEEQVNRSRPG
jgi:hypothetical protein